MSENALDTARAAYAAKRAEYGDTPTSEQIEELTQLAAAIEAQMSTTAETTEVEAQPESEETMAASVAAPATAPSAKGLSLVAAADVPGHPVGSEMDTLEVARAVTRKASSLRGPASAWTQFQLAQIQKPVDPRFSIQSDDHTHVSEVIAFATNEANTPQGSLVASGGWCTPSETWYDLLDYSTTDGLLSIPEVTLRRGGVRLIPGGGPQFAEIYADTGFCFTEAQDISGDYGPAGGAAQPKNCYKVECPDWQDYRLEVCGVCITAGILQNKAFPELTQDVITKSLKAHRHRIDSNVIADIVTGSTSVVIPTLGADPGVAAPILNAIELQAIDIRTKYRMSENATLEAKFPSWAKGVIRADLAYRQGMALFDVTDAMVDAWFRLRNIAPQYLVNFQPLGGSVAATAYPTSLSFLIYPAGTWVKGASDIIDLGVVYSPEQFTYNNYTALFTEEGYNVLPVGPESRVVELEICPSGAVGTQSVACSLSV